MDPNELLQSEREGVVRSVRPFQIHGARFIELAFRLDDDPENTMRRARVSDNLVYRDPGVGDRIRIQMLMGNVTRVEKIE